MEACVEGLEVATHDFIAPIFGCLALVIPNTLPSALYSSPATAEPSTQWLSKTWKATNFTAEEGLVLNIQTHSCEAAFLHFSGAVYIYDCVRKSLARLGRNVLHSMGHRNRVISPLKSNVNFILFYFILRFLSVRLARSTTTRNIGITETARNSTRTRLSSKLLF
ncbi:hypothetical protein QOT17_004763 [Balamuthia mandrillaris]